MKRIILFIVWVISAGSIAANPYSMDEIILDIYRAMTELGDVDYEQLQTDLYALHETPIDLNATTDEELQQLPFLSPRQIDDLLAYADRHPFESVYELQLIPSLSPLTIRNMLPFVKVGKSQESGAKSLYAREVFHYAKHEVLTRVDARDIEGFEGTDPMYLQGRYRFDFQRRVVFGAQLRRPAGGKAKDLQYGAYLQLKDIGPLHTLVAGNFQASFGQGLVLASPFHSGKSAYVSTVGLPQEGLRYYSSVDGEGLHGVGATFRREWNRQTRLDVSALYSMRRANDSTWHHLVGANVTVRYKRLHVQLTAIENIWSDSIRPYRNTNYNQHYFRGRTQAVIGASARYNHGWFDLFGEVAAAENREQWGVGVLAGSRFYPTDGVSLLALYRYYSPHFDNALGYAFSETSRLGDENGGYLGFELTRWKNWRIWGYADVFGFSGPKYGIPNAPSIGFDALVEARYQWLSLRLRAKQKGDLNTYSTRAQFDWMEGPWSLRSTAEANLTKLSTLNSQLHYGVTVYQDIAYQFQQAPLSLRGRLQFFDAREWNNRIYTYEHDVLYAFSIPAVYGLGGRAYVCLRWQIIPQLALYCRVSETLWQKAWYSAHHPAWTGKGLPSRTDIHLLLRASL